MDEKMEKAWIAATSACVEVIDGEHQYVAPVSPEQWERALNAAFDAARLREPAEAQAQGGGEASEGWHAALDSASELVSNAPDARYRKRAEQVRDWIKAHPAAPPSAPVGVEHSGYVATVPDKCDRIVWRGLYHHLPLAQQPAALDGWEALADQDDADLEVWLGDRP